MLSMFGFRRGSLDIVIPHGSNMFQPKRVQERKKDAKQRDVERLSTSQHGKRRCGATVSISFHELLEALQAKFIRANPREQGLKLVFFPGLWGQRPEIN